MNFFLYFIIISNFIIRINNFPKLIEGFKCYEKKPLTIKFKDINILNYKDIISNNKIFLLYVTATLIFYKNLKKL